ncbi:MAG TPA: Xaa-Pro peptidase family protein [Candidatus Acidoferrales bacterium]|jgi:Xaa-Pro aminopeptidase|nr:Xaa-Pro peptidase family protein [Candidatus Acidoferrales bacterium]
MKRKKAPQTALVIGLVVIAVFCLSQLAQARFRQPNEEYQARRAKLRAAIDAPLVIFGYTGHEDASEVAVFYQEPYFYYLTGHDEPGAALILLPAARNAKPSDGPQEILYLPARDLDQEKWEGPRMGPNDPDIAAKTGFQAVEPFDNLKSDLERLAKTDPDFYTLIAPGDEDGYPHFTKMNDWLRNALPRSTLRDVTSTLDAMRQIKSPGELALLQKAVDLSIEAHLDAMRQMRPGLFEYQIAARMKEVHEWGGCEREAYAPIVGAGFNSTVLHYSALDSEINDGDVVVIDVGGEYGGYAADITRTLRANGKFTPRQREIYDIVLGAQNAAIDAIKPGARLYGEDHSLQQIAAAYINTHGRDKEGRTLGRYFIHGVSHHLGLDVHDPGDRTRPLEPGMVVTVEPGIYIPEENLGVRIEDDVLVTKDGHQLLTARLPRNADEIENVMAQAATARAQAPPQ